MEVFCETIPGLEDCVKKKNKKVLAKGLILFKKNIKPDNCMIKIYKALVYSKFKSKSDIIKKIGKENIKIKGSFVVRAKRSGSHKFNSLEIERKIGALIKNKDNFVDFKNPKHRFTLRIVDNFFVFGKVNWERESDYLIKRSFSSISPTLASCILNFINFSKSDYLVNPLCKDGVIPIEAALSGAKKILGFDTSHNIKGARVNAKLAKVNPKIFESFNLEWVDTKIKEKSVDKVISVLPFVSKNKREIYIRSLYSKFLEGSEFMLKPKGLMCVILEKKDLFLESSKKRFKIVKQRNLFIGNTNYHILVLKSQTR